MLPEHFWPILALSQVDLSGPLAERERTQISSITDLSCQLSHLPLLGPNLGRLDREPLTRFLEAHFLLRSTQLELNQVTGDFL